MIEITVSDLNGKIDGPPEAIKLARKVFRMERGLHAKRAAGNNVPDHIYMVTKKGLFKTGMLSLLLRLYDKEGVKYKLKDVRRIKSPPDMEDVKINLSYMPFDLRDYQMDALLKGLVNKNGIFYAATGTGKTVIMAALLQGWYKKSMVLINQVDLALQLQEELSEYMDEKVGLIGNGIWNPERVTVCIDRSIENSRQGKRKRKRVKKFCESIEHLCFDECHHVQSPTWRKIARKCKNASVRHGFSATPMTSEIKIDGGFSNLDLYLWSYIGPVIFNYTTKDAIEAGYLAKPTIYFTRNELYWDGITFEYNEEFERIVIDCDSRNDLICKIIKKHYDKGEQTVGFVERIPHGEEVARRLVEKFDVDPEDIAFVNGETYQNLRKENISEFKAGALPIIIGTVLSEGLNFFCDAGINIAGGKSKKNAIQRLGRILRKKNKLPSGDVDTSVEEFVNFYDFADLEHKWFEKHAEKRLTAYFEEGHDIEFLNPSEV